MGKQDEYVTFFAQEFYLDEEVVVAVDGWQADKVVLFFNKLNVSQTLDIVGPLCTFDEKVPSPPFL